MYGKQVIMVVEDADGDRILLGRRVNGVSGQFTALSGFVDAGESIEEAGERPPGKPLLSTVS
jgi:NADH pyrophosphatase NudC (nudix superfamily)